MQIKRFEAKDMKTALRSIKKELGSDAIILSARSLKKENKIIGRVKSLGVEVTAAVDGSQLPAEIKPALNAGALNSYRRHAGRSFEAAPKRNFRQSVGNRIKNLYVRKQPHPPGITNRSGTESLLSDVFQHLLSQEVKRDIANDVVDALKDAHSEGDRFDTIDRVISGISNILKQKSGRTEAQPRSKSACRVIAVVGPTGVGKTTTVAKLAARYAIERHKNVALISLDSDRIGGTGDLKIYAQAIGIPVKAAATADAFRAAVEAVREFDLVLVDTSGFNPNDQNQIDKLKTYLESIGAVEIHLALSATAKESDLFNTLRCLDTLNVGNLIFTKLDESGTCGNLFNVLIQYPLPLSFVTDGREVPNAIKAGSIDHIVEQLLANFKRRKSFSGSSKPDDSPQISPAPVDAGTFVANKNSDVFHRPECKWTQKIKSKNTITFSSAAAAEAEHFLPCQDCRPARSRGFRAGLTARDHMRISNYS